MAEANAEANTEACMGTTPSTAEILTSPDFCTGRSAWYDIIMYTIAQDQYTVFDNLLGKYNEEYTSSVYEEILMKIIKYGRPQFFKKLLEILPGGAKDYIDEIVNIGGPAQVKMLHLLIENETRSYWRIKCEERAIRTAFRLEKLEILEYLYSRQLTLNFRIYVTQYADTLPMLKYAFEHAGAFHKSCWMALQRGDIDRVKYLVDNGFVFDTTRLPAWHRSILEEASRK